MAKGRLIYSAAPGGPGPPATGPAPATPSSRAPAEHAIRVRREKAGRGGKTVTTAGPLFLTQSVAEELLAALKRGCGAGGTLRIAEVPDGALCFVLEIQGDHADRVVAELTRRGFPAKRAGG